MTFTLLVLLLGQSEPDMKRVRDLLIQAEQTAAGVKDDYLRSNAWREIAASWGEAGDDTQALVLIEKIPNAYEKSLSYASAAKALAKTGAREAAHRIVKAGLKNCGEGEQDFKTGNAYAHLVIALAESGDFDGAIRRLQAIPEGFSDREFATVHVALCLARKGEISRSVALLKTIAGSNRDWKVRDVVDQAVKDTDPAALRPLIELIQDPYLRGITQESIAKEQLCRGKTDESVETARSIEDGRAKSSALCSLARELLGKNDELARTLLTLSQTTARDISEAWGRGRALSVNARMWARAGNRQAALKLAPEVEAARKKLTVDHERTMALSGVAIAYASGGDLAKALEFLGASANDWALGMLAEGLVEAGDFAGALKVAGSCKNVVHRAKVLYLQSKEEPQSEEARKLRVESATLMEKVDAKFKELNDIRNGTPEQELLQHLMEAFAAAGDFETSTKIALRRQKDMGPWIGSFALRSASRAQAQAGQLEESLKWINGVEDPLARSLALAGAAEGALKRARR